MHLGLVCEAKLLEDEHVASSSKGWQHVLVDNVVGSARVAWVETTQKVHHELGVEDGVADIAEGINGLLHALTELVDGEVTLCHRMELFHKEDSTRRLVGLEQIHDCNP
jgi:hypothetical protein